MMHGFAICEDARRTVSEATSFASTVRNASIECPEAVTRNAPFIREQIEATREALAAIEAKLPRLVEIKDAA